MKIKSVIHDYEVLFYDKPSEIKVNPDFVIISHTVSHKHILDEITFKAPCIILKSTESIKTIDTVLGLWKAFKEHNLNKSSTVLAIGGGIIQDIVSFACALYYRQINWEFIPTTMLSQVDSCIGGKMGLNFQGYKNLLGSFYPPTKIHICPEFNSTLSDKDYRSGIGELVKICLMEDMAEWNTLEFLMPELLEKVNLKAFIEDALELKKRYIEKDEFDKSDRVYLNYGHTLGHALEKTSNYEVPHGLAVLIGIAIANNISEFNLLLNKEDNERIIKIIKSVLNIKLNKDWFIPEKLIEAAKSDKKRLHEPITMVLLSNDDPFGVVMFKREIEPKQIEMAINKFMENFCELIIN